MAYKLKYLQGAYASIDLILDYLAMFYQGKAARRFRQDLKSSIRKLKEYPYMAPECEDTPRYRRLVVGQYLVYYLVDDESQTVSIYRVLRASWNQQPE